MRSALLAALLLSGCELRVRNTVCPPEVTAPMTEFILRCMQGRGAKYGDALDPCTDVAVLVFCTAPQTAKGTRGAP